MRMQKGKGKGKGKGSDKAKSEVEGEDGNSNRGRVGTGGGSSDVILEGNDAVDSVDVTVEVSEFADIIGDNLVPS